MSAVHFPNGLQHLRPGVADLRPDQQGRGLLHQQGHQEHQQEQQVSQRYGQFLGNIFMSNNLTITDIENGQKCRRWIQYSEQENSAVVEDHSEKRSGFPK